MSVNNLNKLLKSMEPVLNHGVFAYVSAKEKASLCSVKVIASIQEPEGYSAIITEEDAVTLGFPILFRASWITLTVNSDLQAVGFTAAFSDALGKARISCNVVAGAFHDHIFVPVDRAVEAMTVLRNLQSNSK